MITYLLVSVFAQNKQKRSKGFVNVRDINQELLLSIPELLPRLVSLAVSKACKLTFCEVTEGHYKYRGVFTFQYFGS